MSAKSGKCVFCANFVTLLVCYLNFVCLASKADTSSISDNQALNNVILRDAPPRPSVGSGVDISGIKERVLTDHILYPALPIETQTPSYAPSQLDMMTLQAPLPRIGFNGVIDSPATGTPPDTHIAVGSGAGASGRVIMVTNRDVRIWDKNGQAVGSTLRLNTMFSASCFDPKILYDEHSGRFFIVCLEGSDTGTLSNIHIAVSSTSNPNNLTTNWTLLVGSALTTIGSKVTWADYPGIGADANSLFVTTNLFSGSNFQGIKIRIFDKAALIAGSYSYVDINYRDSVVPVGTTAPAHVYGTTDNGGFYLISRLSQTTYRLFNITGAPHSPVATTNTYAWSAGADPPITGAAQPGIFVTLDTVPSRVMNAVYQGGHIWLCLTADPDNDGVTEVVWQDIVTNGGPPSLPSVYQSGYISGSTTGSWTFMPSININSIGDVAVCFTQSSFSQYPSVLYSVRMFSDPAGTFRPPVTAKSGPGYYDSFYTGNPDRWGDYSGCVVDPDDDAFWVANEFSWSSAPGNSTWATFIAGFCAPIPGDFNLDCSVDFYDYAMLAFAWRTTSVDVNWNPVCDISMPADNVIDETDLAVFAQNWLK